MSTLQSLAERVAQGEALGAVDATAIAATHDLVAIGLMADDVRRQLHGTKTTYLRVFEMHVDAVPAEAPAALSAGEFRIVGAPATLEAACAAVEQARRLAGGALLSGFSLADLLRCPGAAAGPFDALRRSGLDAIAETPVDTLEDAAAAVAAARGAGLRVQRITVHGAAEDPVALVDAALRLQRSVGGFRAFAPLPRTVSAVSPTTGYDDVKLVVLARLLVRDVPSVQVDWPLYGPKLAQVALTMGADDVDGIAAVDSGKLGPRRGVVEEIRANIRAAGFEPIERDGAFEAR